MEQLVSLIKAITDLLWVGIAGVSLYAFRREIKAALGRLRRGKVGNIEIELDQLNQSAMAAQQVPALPPSPASEAPPPVPLSSSVERDSTAAVEEASRSPKLGLILLATEIERELRAFLAATGRHRGRRFVPLMAELESLELPQTLIQALRQFWSVRNKLVHGYETDPEAIARAIDSGLRILTTLRSIPREVNVVYHPGVDLYANPQGRVKLEGVRGLVLETTSPDGFTKSLRIFPTTRDDYVRGKQVAWEWNGGRTYGPAWYRDPDTGELKQAWSSSMEFIGRHLEEV